MDAEKIDIHRSKQRYRNAIEKFKTDETISRRNKELITAFLRDCELGKTVKKRAKKIIGERRLFKYLFHLRTVARCHRKDFDRWHMQDMEDFIIWLEKDLLETPGRDGFPRHLVYSPQTKRDIKVCLRKFYKWLWGNNENEPEIVAWLDTSEVKKDLDALDEREAERLVEYGRNLMEKALVWTLYESGARPEEFLNIRLRHVAKKESHFTIRIEYPKTFKRSCPIFEEPFRVRGFSYLKQWLESHPRKDAPDAPLFPVPYRTLLDIFDRVGRKALNRGIPPKLLRDSRATYLAKKKVGRYQMCKLMGWAMSSRMPDRYIDRAGVEEEDAVKAIRNDDHTELHKANLDLKTKLLQAERKVQEMEERLSGRKEADGLMTRLMEDKAVQELLVRKVRELGLAANI
ncbi:tyrosine-type recombinase/integrase [Nitrospinota bacterium]